LNITEHGDSTGLAAIGREAVGWRVVGEWSAGKD